MTAITSNKARQSKYDPSALVFRFEAAEAIVAGALVAQDGTGKVENATDDGYSVVGVALSAAASGEKLDISTGIWGLAASGTITSADVGKDVYAVDNNTVGLVGTTTNDNLVGQLVGVDAAGQLFVKIAFAQ